jgi:hypothetical protein
VKVFLPLHFTILKKADQTIRVRGANIGLPENATWVDKTKKRGYQHTLLPRKVRDNYGGRYSYLATTISSKGNRGFALPDLQRDAALARGETFAPTKPRRILQAIRLIK